MITGKEDLQEALSEAFALEKGTKEFYEFAASKALTDGVKGLFQRLRDWEDGHMHYIEFLYRSLQGDRDFLSYEEFSKRAPADYVEAGIRMKTARRMFEERAFVDDSEAVDFALGIEGKAYNLYRKQSESAKDVNARVVFAEMMSQEQKHIDYLTEMKKKGV